MFLNKPKLKIVEIKVKKIGAILVKEERECIFTFKLPKLKSIL